MNTCSICQKQFKVLGLHVHRTHKFTDEQYLTQYPGEVLWPTPQCAICKTEVFGYSLGTVNVKCDTCRVTVPYRCKTDLKPGHHVCGICGIVRKRLSAHVHKVHQMTSEEYLTQFPGSVLEILGGKRSPECREKQSQAAIRRWSNPVLRDIQSEKMKVSAPWLGKNLSDEHRAAISTGGRGVKHHLTPENAKALGVRGKTSLEKLRLRPDQHMKLSLAMKRRLASGQLIGLMDPETRAKSLASRIRNGTLSPPNGGRGISGFRQGIPNYCRSTFEANFVRILLLEGVFYEQEPRLFKLPSGKYYTPDFYLHGSFAGMSGWVELKGWRLKDGRVPTWEKIQEFESLGESLFVLALCDELWVELEARYKPSIPLWESPTKNLRTHPEIFGR